MLLRSVYVDRTVEKSEKSVHGVLFRLLYITQLLVVVVKYLVFIMLYHHTEV